MTQDAPTPTDPPLPEVEGYRLLREVGRGGMSTVYLAEQLALGREVALKVMARQALADEISRRRFENEVRTIARLEHPHIVRIHELGRTRDGLPYYSMPYLVQGHLGESDRTADEPGSVAVAEALLSALEYAHSRGVVHRDVKPENVLFDDAGRPLLADFGIALRRGFGPRVTAAGLAVGSTAYMAPEQARGEDVDGRADLYSLGVVIWEMLAGRLPYEAGDALSMALMHAQNPIPRLPVHLRHWQRFMNRALAKSADQRFQNAAEMREAMRAVRPAWWAPIGDRARSLARSPMLRKGALAAVALAAIAGGMMFLPLPQPPAPAPVKRAAPIVQTPATAPAVDPTDAMLAPPPGAELEIAIENARARIARGPLVSKTGEDARAAVLDVWQRDPDDPRVQKLATEFVDALRGRLVTAVSTGSDTRARELAAGAIDFDRRTQSASVTGLASLQKDSTRAVRKRFDEAVRTRNRKAADGSMALAADLGVPAADLARWRRELAVLDRAETPRPRAAAKESSAELMRRPVTRADFERFVEATGRPPALCRERGSVLRVLAPRSWRDPGFPQGPSDPVVCVSMQDAEAYALWLGSRTGRRYRIPTVAEAARLPPDTGGRALALWSRDCGYNCLQRVVAGVSWRGAAVASRRVANRGYDDVGFRLYRER